MEILNGGETLWLHAVLPYPVAKGQWTEEAKTRVVRLREAGEISRSSRQYRALLRQPSREHKGMSRIECPRHAEGKFRLEGSGTHQQQE